MLQTSRARLFVASADDCCCVFERIRVDRENATKAILMRFRWKRSVSKRKSVDGAGFVACCKTLKNKQKATLTWPTDQTWEFQPKPEIVSMTTRNQTYFGLPLHHCVSTITWLTFMEFNVFQTTVGGFRLNIWYTLWVLSLQWNNKSDVFNYSRTPIKRPLIKLQPPSYESPETIVSIIL